MRSMHPFPPSARLQRRLKRMKQVLIRERLRQDLVRPQLFGQDKIVQTTATATSGHGDNLEIRPLLSDFLDCLQAFFLRHNQIG